MKLTLASVLVPQISIYARRISSRTKITMLRTTIVVLLCCINTIYGFEFPKNPCPSVFDYIYNGKEWFGYITVPAPLPSANIAEISANFSIEGYITSYGPIKLDEYDKALDKIKYGHPLNFVITLPKSKYLPTVTHIEYNGNIICSGPPVPAPRRTSFWLQYTFNWTGVFNPQQTQIYYTIPHQTISHPTYPTYPTHPIVVTYSPKPAVIHPKPEVIFPKPAVISPKPAIVYTSPPHVSVKPVVSKPKKFNNYKECGMIRKKRTIEEDDYSKRIINGTVIPRNAHPWLAALFDVTPGKMEFFCAGNLISNKHVLTAAHCTIVKQHSNILVRLGVHNTNNKFDPGTQSVMVKTVVEHAEYQSGNAHADVAFLILKNEVVFTQAIKPICLWNYDSDFGAIIGYLGTIMGWGKQENGEQSTIPMKTDVTIATKQKCKEIDLLKNFVTDETFCAGTKGTGPCLGDSGGGLFIAIDGKWYLRGIISTSIADRYTQICDVNTYSVYVDTAKYMDWIMDNMEHN